MKILTINQTIDLITSYFDEIKPAKAPQSLYAELKHLKELKFEHPKGGLLPYKNGRWVERLIKDVKEIPFGSQKVNFGKSFNSAQKFAHNRLAI